MKPRAIESGLNVCGHLFEWNGYSYLCARDGKHVGRHAGFRKDGSQPDTLVGSVEPHDPKGRNYNQEMADIEQEIKPAPKRPKENRNREPSASLQRPPLGRRVY